MTNYSYYFVGKLFEPMSQTIYRHIGLPIAWIYDTIADKYAHCGRKAMIWTQEKLPPRIHHIALRIFKGVPTATSILLAPYTLGTLITVTWIMLNAMHPEPFSKNTCEQVLNGYGFGYTFLAVTLLVRGVLTQQMSIMPKVLMNLSLAAYSFFQIRMMEKI